MKPVHRPCRARPRAFTLVEMLVVVGVTALILGLVMAAMSGVKDRSRVATQESNVRQVGLAWTMYANDADGGIIPGYLSAAAQADWNVRYNYADGRPIPPHQKAELPDDFKDTNIAGTWVWRLMPYLDHEERILMAHRDEVELEELTREERALEVSRSPAFGYNGLFVGGWYYDGKSCHFNTAKVHETERNVSVVSRHLGGINDSAGLLVFASAGERLPGLEKFDDSDIDDGSFMVTPPIIGTNELWGIATQIGSVEDGGGGTNFGTQVGGHAYAVEYYGSGNWTENPAPFG